MKQGVYVQHRNTYTDEESENYAAGIRKYGTDYAKIQKYFLPDKSVKTLRVKAGNEITKYSKNPKL